MRHLHNHSNVQKNRHPPFSLRPTWQRLELCWHLSSLSGLILWLCSHGVRGKAGVAMATPVDGAIELWERWAQGGAVATHQHLSFHHPHSLKQFLYCLHPLKTCKSLFLSLLLLQSLLTVITATSTYRQLKPHQLLLFTFYFKKVGKKKSNLSASWFLLSLCILLLIYLSCFFVCKWEKSEKSITLKGLQI